MTSHRRNKDSLAVPRPQGGITVDGSHPCSVVDIGSNSVRLVVYEDAARNLVPIFNEKVLAGLGGSIAQTGRLDEEGRTRALRALTRFAAVMRQLQVEETQVVATAAVRDATDGAEFMAEAVEILGKPVRLLSGEEEAEYAALGVLSGIPDADGIVGDLGGGSLELVDIRNGRLGRKVTLPLGPLRLKGQTFSSLRAQTDYVDEVLSEVDWLADGAGRQLYVVGGVWRNLARLHMAHEEYPIHVLHQYSIPAKGARELAELVERQGPKSLSKIAEVSSRRVDALPLGALVLERLIKHTGSRGITVSAHGLREGLLYGSLPKSEQKKDPLIEGARELADRLIRYPAHADALDSWTSALFNGTEGGESDAQARLRKAACILADIGWYVHPDYRASYALEQVLLAPLSGIEHRDRVFLARVGYHRHEGASEPTFVNGTGRLLNQEEGQRARILGLALRLAFTLSASMSGVLPFTQLVVEKKQLVLQVRKSHADFVGEVVDKRLAALGKAMGRKAETRLV